MNADQASSEQARASGPGLSGAAPAVILLATDLSARSDRALGRAVALAVRHQARLVALHVFDEDLPASLREDVRSAAEAQIAGQIEQASGGADLALEIIVSPGKDYRDIIACGEAVGAELIVMGVHRNESGDKPLAGTTLERVIRHGRLPVLVATELAGEAYRSVMVGVDFSVFSRIAIRGASALAPEAALHMVHAFLVPYAGFQPGADTRRDFGAAHEAELKRLIEEELAALADSARPGAAPAGPVETVTRHGETRIVLREEVERADPDLLVLGTHGRTGLGHAIVGSVAEDFLNRPPCDVLVVKAW